MTEFKVVPQRAVKSGRKPLVDITPITDSLIGLDPHQQMEITGYTDREVGSIVRQLRSGGWRVSTEKTEDGMKVIAR